MASSDASDRSWPNWLLPTLIASALAALIAIIVAYCGGPGDQIQTSAGPPPLVFTDTSTTEGRPAQEITDEFLQFAMFDRVREPPWLDRITRVFWAENGQLHAETSYPADWSDTSDPSRPVESICGQLYAYQLREVRQWTGVAVLAVDGTELVVRTDQNGSCRQAG
jgi:hypothetical protein